jgi:hypothetical protein
MSSFKVRKTVFLEEEYLDRRGFDETVKRMTVALRVA